MKTIKVGVFGLGIRGRNLLAHVVDVVMVFAAWEAHIPAAIESMRAGKPIAVEVAAVGRYLISVFDAA